MSVLKEKAKVVMLPTNEKATIIGKYKDVDELVFNTPRDIPRGEQQHLYIISDEEIKEVDKSCWCYNSIKNTWNDDIIYYQGSMPLYHYKGFKKIIATTDSSLKIKSEVYNYSKREYNLPQPSQGFIEKYIKEYNKSNVITDILVEYEEIITKSEVFISKDVPYSNKKLKVSKDNTITIYPIKDSWTREEVENLLRELNKDKQGNFDLTKWIEENL